MDIPPLQDHREHPEAGDTRICRSMLTSIDCGARRLLDTYTERLDLLRIHHISVAEVARVSVFATTGQVKHVARRWILCHIS